MPEANPRYRDLFDHTADAIDQLLQLADKALYRQMRRRRRRP